MSAIRTIPWAGAAALGAPAAAFGTATAFGFNPRDSWLAPMLIGYTLLAGGCLALARQWSLTPAKAIALGLVGAAWSIPGWAAGIFILLVVGSAHCDRAYHDNVDGAWIISLALGVVVYLALSVWALHTPRRVAAWILAPLLGLMCFLPVVWYGGICFD